MIDKIEVFLKTKNKIMDQDLYHNSTIFEGF